MTSYTNSLPTSESVAEQAPGVLKVRSRPPQLEATDAKRMARGIATAAALAALAAPGAAVHTSCCETLGMFFGAILPEIWISTRAIVRK